MRVLIFIFVVLLIVLAGCGGHGSGKVALQPAPTGREALLRVVDALKSRDEHALAVLIDGDADAQDFFRSLVDSARAVDEFRVRFIEAYGQEAWARFQSPKGDDGHGAHMNLELPDFQAIEDQLSTWNVTSDNQGRCDVLRGVPLQVKKIDGGWVVEGQHLFSDRQALRQTTQLQNALAAFIRKYIKALGRNGISAEDVDYQMGKDMIRCLMGVEFVSGGKQALPDRFDIDALKVVPNGTTNGGRSFTPDTTKTSSISGARQ